jgi:tetratricopeptide (TPR) repeat protein
MAAVTLTLPQAMKRAIEAYERGEFDEADRVARAILSAHADYFDAHHLIAVINVRRRRFEDALAGYDRALALRPDDPEALGNRASVLHELKRFGEALENYDRALAVRPTYAEALANRAATLHELRRFDEALTSYDRALVLRPAYAEALSNRAVTLHELKRFDEALTSYDRALALRSDYATALYNRGLTLHELKRFDEALTSYDRALAVRPDYAEAFSNRGNTLHALRFDEALASFDHALALRPERCEALCNRGATLQELKRFDEALTSYDRALVLRPGYAEAHYNCGVTLHELQRFAEALTSYDRALAAEPHYVVALGNRGLVLHALKRFEEALASYDRALALQPNYVEALSNRGNTLHELKRFDEALMSFDGALALRPDYAVALYNRGVTLHELQRFAEALASYDRALALRPDYAEALSNRGNTLHELKRLEEALTSFKSAPAVRPDYAEARWNMSLVQLLTGDFYGGWREYEWRWKNAGLPLFSRDFAQPLWLGENEIEGKTILLHSEQGYGDAIQFCRYVPLVAEGGARVLLEVPAPLQDLMAGLLGVSQVVSEQGPLPHFDLHCPLLSLPLALGTGIETIPANVPYLNVPPDRVSAWEKALGPKRHLRIGLAWSGRRTHKNDANRSISLQSLLPLLNINASFVSLQTDVRPDDARVLPDQRNLVHLGHRLETFSDTAAVISNLDLVISVDTSVAHLTGALAKPVWVLLPFVPDWRWQIDREDSPWYPTARLFRQSVRGDWSGVISRILIELRKLV